LSRFEDINQLAINGNFDLSEFECPCCHRVMLHPLLSGLADSIRDVLAVPLVITSGYRCEQHNLIVGGKSDSFHRIGCAFDFTSPETSDEKIESVLKSLPGIYWYKNGEHSYHIQPLKVKY